MMRAQVTPPECALAAEMFDHFCSAGTMKQILALHREICNTLNLKPNRLPDFYPKIKAKLANSWKAQALFKKFDLRANHKVYGKGRICAQTKVLIIGAGPCGLRVAIECQLLGAKVVVVEKRDRMSRNNVLHLWPFVIQDLRALGAKKFFGKFCAGSIDHISIRQLQCILMKVALLLGVELHEGVSFEELLEPSITRHGERVGWRARVSPAEHPVSQYEFDALVGADGKRNTLHGFKRKEFRGKLAMAITANFINRHSEQEASVPEISGVAFIFNQKFFKELFEVTGIDLENIVYYKDDTHYFVMTAKKHSLLNKGVLLNDYAEVSRLLSVENVERGALMRYAQEAARFSTDGQLPLNDFALNHYGEPDVALFDFTSMYAAENASIVYERQGKRLLCQLVGDSLLEPFWPTGSGCARGFLSALDAAWAVRSWGQTPPPHPLEVIAERESIYRLLAQTTPENLHRDFGGYTLDPGTRYPNLNRTAVTPHRVTSFYDCDEALQLETPIGSRKRRREMDISEGALISWVGSAEAGLAGAAGAQALAALVRRYRPDLMPPSAPHNAVYQVLQHEFGITPFPNTGSTYDVPEAKLRSYLSRVYLAFKGEVPHIHHKYEVFDQIKKSQQKEKHARNTTDHSVSVYSNAAELDKSTLSSRRKRRSTRSSQEEGRVVGGGKAFGGGAHVARLAAELSANPSTAMPKASKPKDLIRSVGKIEKDDWNVKEIEKKIMENRLGRPEPKAAEKVPKWDREEFLKRQRRLKEGDQNDEKWDDIDETINKFNQKVKDSGRPEQGNERVAKLATKFVKKEEPDSEKAESHDKQSKRSWRGPSASGIQCVACGQRVFAAEGVIADGLHLHRSCFRCAVCNTVLRPGNYAMERYGNRLVCLRHAGVTVCVPDSVNILTPPSKPQTVHSTPERISLELSDAAAREIDEDEWTDRNCLASETSPAGGLSDEKASSDEWTDVESEGEEEARALQAPGPARDTIIHDPKDLAFFSFLSDDSFGYDDNSDEGAESSGKESCSRMRAAREARRREVPEEKRPPTDSSEVESEDESESSDDEVSSATEVSTDSEFAREECVPAPSPPAILVTEAPPPAPPPPQEYPLSRTRSAGGLATKRALELKRRFLLGEPSPPAVRKSDSTSQLDTKVKAFRSNITEFQKMLHPAPAPTTQVQPQKPIVTFRLTEDVQNKIQPMPDIIKNLHTDAQVDLLTKCDLPLCKNDWREPINEEKQEPDLESDSLSDDDASNTDTAPNQTVPRVEVHDEGGELIQLDSLMIINTGIDDIGEKLSATALSDVPTILAAESESSESCRDVTTLALTETELSDWAAESAVLDECGIDDKENKRKQNPRTLSGPKLIHDAKNIAAIASHVCGRSSPLDNIVYSNALEHFEFADEGDQDPSIGTPVTPRNEGYMEFVDDKIEVEPYYPTNDRSMNFFEQAFSERLLKPTGIDICRENLRNDVSDVIEFIDKDDSQEDSVPKEQNSSNITELAQIELSEKSSTENTSLSLQRNTEKTKTANDSTPTSNKELMTVLSDVASISLSEVSSALDKTNSDTGKVKANSPLSKNSAEDISPPLAQDFSLSRDSTYNGSINAPVSFGSSNTIRMYSPAICRSVTVPFNSSISRSGNSDSPCRSMDLSISANISSGSISPASPSPMRDTTVKVQEIKRERDELNDIVRGLVLGRVRSGPRDGKKSSRRTKVSPASNTPPPIPPPPVLPEQQPPPPPPPPSSYTSPPLRPMSPQISLSVSPSLSDPELATERRRKGIMKSISNYLNRRLGPRHKWVSEPDLMSHVSKAYQIQYRELGSRQMSQSMSGAHKSTGTLQESPPPAPPPPVPPPPACYSPPIHTHSSCRRLPGVMDIEERDAMQLWFEARWARLVAQRRARDRPAPALHSRHNTDHNVRLAHLERRLSRPLSAEQQAAAVAELVQVTAQRDAHEALMAADRRRHAASDNVGTHHKLGD
ncbi:PREDICTED: protein-methionine sulfoxide oxidase mical3b isoform X2 [Papilio polytes]|uniref:protein-methionine sulfoxide oxidase mical3b isoform X2 n=1 Tax=Papilio polytes TaxID=76194 RepID=UPI000676ADDA|nr:PREDICTED: protein-methionine sulfoxide oxidase mical3b isoform X2 [Papilio polytes]